MPLLADPDTHIHDHGAFHKLSPFFCSISSVSSDSLICELLINRNTDAEHLCKFPTEKLDQELIRKKGMIRKINKMLSMLIINDRLFIDVSLMFSWKRNTQIVYIIF